MLYIFNTQTICLFSIYMYPKSQHTSGLFVYTPCHKVIVCESNSSSNSIIQYNFRPNVHT